MNKWLYVSDELALPIEFVTSTQAILAKRGVGKSHTASVQAEEMLRAKLPIIAIDPTGAWYGLKSSRDGNRPGFPVAVFGGEHADVPLEDTAGETIATAIVRNRFSAIIDLSLMRKHQWYKFLAPFLETLYLLNREPVHLFVDEAHKLAPQKLLGGDPNQFRVLGAMEDIGQMGRRKGIGCTVITQRPAVLNKNLLTQCELLCVMRLIHNLDIDAVKDWIDVHGDKEKAKQLITDLPSLPVGTAWFWSPGMSPEIFAKVHIRERETFDSGATPELGKKVRPPKVLAQIDLEKLGEQIKATVERAKADDPAALRKRIKELESEAAKSVSVLAVKPGKIEKLDRDKMHEAQLAEVQRIISGVFRPQLKSILGLRWHSLPNTLRETADLVEKTIAIFDDEKNWKVEFLSKQAVHSLDKAIVKVEPVATPNPVTVRVHPTTAAVVDGTMSPGERIILTAIVQFGSSDSDQLGVLTSYKTTSRYEYCRKLAAKGYIDNSGPLLKPTQAGIDALGSSYEPLPTGRKLYEWWCQRLGGAELKLLQFLVDKKYGKAATFEELEEAANIKATSRYEYVRKLKARRLVATTGREVLATESLF